MVLSTVLYRTPWGTWESLTELTEFSDTWFGVVGLNYRIFGGDGNDMLDSGGGDDFLAGGNGNDTIYGGSGFDNIFGDGGNDTLVGEGGIDQLYGGDGDDVLVSHYLSGLALGIESISDAAFDYGGFMDGGAGNDVLFVDVALDGALGIDGGTGTDRIDFNADLNVWFDGVPSSLPFNQVDLEAGNGTTALGGTLTVARVERIFGGDYRDKFLGNDQVNELRGRNNNDVLEGRGGADTLDGGSGQDSAQYASASSGVTVDLSLATQALTRLVNGTSVSNGDAAGDVLVSIEEVKGSNYADVLKGRTTTGTASAEKFYGSGGNDIIEGRTGGDYIDGGTAFDFASYETSNGSVSVVLARTGFAGSAQLAHAAGDTLVSIEGLIGSAYGDTLVGNDANNELLGNGGNDLLTGMGGADNIKGGTGSDKIWGGTGRDVLAGETGSDTFVFALGDSNGTYNQRDVINGFQKDFNLGTLVVQGDTIDLSGIDADTRTTSAGNQAFSFIGDQNFSAAGQVRVSRVLDAIGMTYNLMQAEVNGDGITDLQVTVYMSGPLPLTSSDFLL